MYISIYRYRYRYIDIYFSLGPHPRHMEVPRLGSNPIRRCWSTPEPQQWRMWATSVTFTSAHGKAGCLTHWARPGIEPASSKILVRFVSVEPQWELLPLLLSPIFCHPSASGVSGPGNRSKLQLWPNLQLHARSLIHCAGLGMEAASQHSQDAADPIAPQWELRESINKEWVPSP